MKKLNQKAITLDEAREAALNCVNEITNLTDELKMDIRSKIAGYFDEVFGGVKMITSSKALTRQHNLSGADFLSEIDADTELVARIRMHVCTAIKSLLFSDLPVLLEGFIEQCKTEAPPAEWNMKNLYHVTDAQNNLWAKDFCELVTRLTSLNIYDWMENNVLPKLPENWRNSFKKTVDDVCSIAPLADHSHGVMSSTVPEFDYILKLFGDTDPLSIEQERTLARQAILGDKEATTRLMAGQIRLMLLVVNEYWNSTENNDMQLSELVAQAIDALYETVKAFNPETGYRFNHLAMRNVKHAMNRAVRTSSSNGGEATPDGKIVIKCFTSLFDSDKVEDYTVNIADKRTDSIPELVDEKEKKAKLRDTVRAAVLSLPPKLQCIVIDHFGLNGAEPKTHKQIGEALGCTKQAIHLRDVSARALLEQRLKYIPLEWIGR
jgi:RNA polymerase sigma factor (sigma-70 family)